MCFNSELLGRWPKWTLFVGKLYTLLGVLVISAVCAVQNGAESGDLGLVALSISRVSEQSHSVGDGVQTHYWQCAGLHGEQIGTVAAYHRSLGRARAGQRFSPGARRTTPPTGGNESPGKLSDSSTKSRPECFGVHGSTERFFQFQLGKFRSSCPRVPLNWMQLRWRIQESRNCRIPAVQPANWMIPPVVQLLTVRTPEKFCRKILKARPFYENTI